MAGLQGGYDPGAGVRVVPARLVQGELVRHRQAQGYQVSQSHIQKTDYGPHPHLTQLYAVEFLVLPARGICCVLCGRHIGLCNSNSAKIDPHGRKCN
jgi:hypothetical protein